MLEMVVVNAASLNQVNVPKAQVPASVLDSPEQIADGLAVKAVGADGMVVTLTLTFAEGLVQIPFTQAA
jgi:putative heme iron utilization protein